MLTLNVTHVTSIVTVFRFMWISAIWEIKVTGSNNSLTTKRPNWFLTVDKITIIRNPQFHVKLQRVCTQAGTCYFLLSLSIDKLCLYLPFPLGSLVPAQFLHAHPLQFSSSSRWVPITGCCRYQNARWITEECLCPVDVSLLILVENYQEDIDFCRASHA